MSWDVSIKEVSCPCGKGKITQVVKDDDWNRYKEETPEIECEECKEKYEVCIIHNSNHKGEDHKIYYLMPKGTCSHLEIKNSYGWVDFAKLAKTDFASYLIVRYPKYKLQMADEDLAKATSCSSLKGAAKEMAKDKKMFTGSCKIEELRPFVKKALDGFDSYNGDRDQRDKEETENNQTRREFNAKVRCEGTLLDF